jgi:hypothetical protein
VSRAVTLVARDSPLSDGLNLSRALKFAFSTLYDDNFAMSIIL